MRLCPPLNRRGAVAAIIATLAVVLIGCVGLAIDMTRAFMVSSRLKTAVDAAALYAAREIDNTNGTAYRDARATELFWVNYRANRAANAASYIGSTVTSFAITPVTGDTTQLQVSATATLDTTLFSVIGRRTMTVNAVSVAQRQAIGLEMALVVDATTSMVSASNVPGLTKLQAAQQAIGTLLNILYAGADTQQNLWVAVVPFARSINIGTANSALLNTTNMPTGWAQANWNGCVEARTTASNDLNDSAPTTPATRFRPYFYPSTFQQVGTVAAGNCTSGNAYAAVNGTAWCRGENDWGATAAQLATNPVYNFNRNYSTLAADLAGPNMWCARSPVAPLTASRSAVVASVNAITATGFSGGTMIPTGLAGGWYMLSPNWQNVWPDPNPSGGPVLPLAYNTRNMRKAMVILSDGDNNWAVTNSWRSGSSTVRSPVVGNNGGNDLNYSAYGRAANWNGPGFAPPIVTPPSFTLSSGSNPGDAAMDARTATLCSNIKAQGITIFIIGFEVQTAAQRSMLQTCASGTASPYYLEAPSAAQLQAAFTTIANTLSSLRLAE